MLLREQGRFLYVTGWNPKKALSAGDIYSKHDETKRKSIAMILVLYKGEGETKRKDSSMMKEK